MPAAICLLSGGLDSSTCLGVARREGYECYALSFDYGQRHRIERATASNSTPPHELRNSSARPSIAF
jgi:7-cyano-7-deazaguanine synthase